MEFLSGAVKIVSLAQLATARRRRITKDVSGRSITVLRHGEKIFALDSACYHLGGPLGEEGDIEDSADRTCIVCPWHQRKIDLSTGQHLDTDLSGTVCASIDVKQRTYPIAIDNEGWVWIDVSKPSAPAVPSDKYNCTSQSTSSGSGYGLGSMGPGSSWQREPNWGCEVPPLTPFAGINKKACPPSPVKGSQRAEVKTLPFRAQKGSLRNSAARMAVLASLKAPPLFQEVAPLPSRGPVQKTLEELYARKAAQDMMEA